MLENLYVSFSGKKRRALGQGLKSNSLHHLFWIKPRSLKTKSESDLSRLFQRLIFQSKRREHILFQTNESPIVLLLQSSKCQGWALPPLQHCMIFNQLLVSEPPLPSLQNKGSISNSYSENLKCSQFNYYYIPFASYLLSLCASVFSSARWDGTIPTCLIGVYQLMRTKVLEQCLVHSKCYVNVSCYCYYYPLPMTGLKETAYAVCRSQ